MPITTCPKCGELYEEISEEEANNPNRTCMSCWNIFKDGERSNDNNRSKNCKNWISNPHPPGTNRHTIWNEGYSYRDMVNDG